MSSTPPDVPGDDKDWTWVLDDPCPECGFDAATFARDEVAGMLRANSREWVGLLAGDESALRRRREPGVWSPLEYACHVRDVHRLYLERLELMLTHDAPRYANWDQDITAVEQRYDLSDPSAVGAELAEASDALAERFDSVSGEDWERTGHRSDGAVFTVDTFARYFIHDPIHHLWDVRR